MAFMGLPWPKNMTGDLSDIFAYIIAHTRHMASRAWQNTIAAVTLNEGLYIVEKSGGLYLTYLTSGKWRQIDQPDFAETSFLFAALPDL